MLHDTSTGSCRTAGRLHRRRHLLKLIWSRTSTYNAVLYRTVMPPARSPLCWLPALNALHVHPRVYSWNIILEITMCVVGYMHFFESCVSFSTKSKTYTLKTGKKIGGSHSCWVHSTISEACFTLECVKIRQRYSFTLTHVRITLRHYSQCGVPKHFPRNEHLLITNSVWFIAYTLYSATDILYRIVVRKRGSSSIET